MEFTKNDRGQRDVTNKIIILTKQRTDRIHTVITTKNRKYTSTTILKHVNVLAKVNKSSYGLLPNIMLHDTHIITIRVRKVTLPDISHEQELKNPITKHTGY